ncbi:MAG: type II toxin-antitoxin system VapC family toxin [Neisseriaceae bacterium]|nr:type II toxin-antitoxin system VapC family toxin [Neisseriaceae bacterium]
MFLLDTNIISEIRKINLGNANIGVKRWAESNDKNVMFISVISLFELEKGVLNLERKDNLQGKIYRQWLDNMVKPTFANRILSITPQTALICAKMHIPDKKSITDSLIAATAIENNLTVITRNEKDFMNTGANVFNPFVTH